MELWSGVIMERHISTAELCIGGLYFISSLLGGYHRAGMLNLSFFLFSCLIGTRLIFNPGFGGRT